jgi:hypothetical protein
MKTSLATLRLNFLFWPVVVFLVVNLLTRHTGGPNAASRFALTMSMVAESTFTIDGYEETTPDWSQTPDGHFYSNKPPGPSFLAYPFAAVFDLFAVRLLADKDSWKEQRLRLWADSSTIQAFLLQVIPFLFLVFYLDYFLKRRNVSQGGRAMAGLSMLFGMTPSFLMNTMFGHGLAALSIMYAMILALDGRHRWSAFAFGIAMLSDYGSAFILPGLIYLWFVRGVARRDLLRLIKDVSFGAIFPAVLWIWYHQVSFGSPFTTSHKYLAPEWVSVPKEKDVLWGIFSSAPDPQVILKLLFSSGRGLLGTQPWVLIVSIFALMGLFRPKAKASDACVVSTISVLSLAMLIVTNASFNGWHGGATMGPRYLSVGLVLFPLVLGLLFDDMPAYVRRILVLSLGIAIFYFAIGFPQDILTSLNPWVEYQELFLTRSPGMMFKVAAQSVLILGVSVACWRRAFSARNS